MLAIRAHLCVECCNRNVDARRACRREQYTPRCSAGRLHITRPATMTYETNMHTQHGLLHKYDHACIFILTLYVYIHLQYAYKYMQLLWQYVAGCVDERATEAECPSVVLRECSCRMSVRIAWYTTCIRSNGHDNVSHADADIVDVGVGVGIE